MPDEKEIKQQFEPKKRSLGKIAVVVGVVLAAGVFVGGVFAGPRIADRFALPGYDAPKPEAVDEEVEEAPVAVTKALDPVIVDVKSADGVIHHIKVGIAVELKQDMKEEDFEKYVPRARDAAIVYLRTLDYNKITEPKEFGAIRKELQALVVKSIGEQRAEGILFTDFVLQ